MTTCGLTVGKLKAMLSSIPDEVVVALLLDPATKIDDHLVTIHQLVAEYSGGPVFRLRPTISEWCPMDLSGGFWISGRGLAVPLSDLVGGKAIPGTGVEVEINSPDGTIQTMWASVELMLAHTSGASTSEAVTLLLRNAPETGFPAGTVARFRGAA